VLRPVAQEERDLHRLLGDGAVAQRASGRGPAHLLRGGVHRVDVGENLLDGRFDGLCRLYTGQKAHRSTGIPHDAHEQAGGLARGRIGPISNRGVTASSMVPGGRKTSGTRPRKLGGSVPLRFRWRSGTYP